MLAYYVHGSSIHILCDYFCSSFFTLPTSPFSISPKVVPHGAHLRFLRQSLHSNLYTNTCIADFSLVSSFFESDTFFFSGATGIHVGLLQIPLLRILSSDLCVLCFQWGSTYWPVLLKLVASSALIPRSPGLLLLNKHIWHLLLLRFQFNYLLQYCLWWTSFTVFFI